MKHRCQYAADMFNTHSLALPENTSWPVSQLSYLRGRLLLACAIIISLIRNLLLLSLNVTSSPGAEVTQKRPETRAAPSLQAMASSHITTRDKAAWAGVPRCPPPGTHIPV